MKKTNTQTLSKANEFALEVFIVSSVKSEIDSRRQTRTSTEVSAKMFVLPKKVS